MTPSPYEAAIMADVKAWLEAIRTANGFHTDAGQSVFLADERMAPADGEERITLIVHDAEEELVQQNGYTRDVNLRIDVECFVPVPRTPSGRLSVRELTRMVLADIRYALLDGLRRGASNPRPINLTLDGRTIAPLENGSNWMVAVQPVLWQTREEALIL